ncbi:ArsR family transcriptional regulator [Halobiforma lacisalsi AJ5]|uniref:ArsR family transcriptional regulator n=1 Tax=Natronobacterium lacisalsi AJ5 TaxID=358396 RepID=M0LHJ5_NATLA|nr:hypothetical protein [Halobiforma lacisalsi]APW98563.1 ArsR family transcriptional regulator [Halobiforma lacisalsi AJ5]EMA33092.1 ArsR family transcriptional regulator [Halobiforma lacisalsi AJ5]
MDEVDEPSIGSRDRGPDSSPSIASPTAEPARAERVSDPSDAFQALGNEIRMGILDTMLERTDGEGPSRVSFSALFEASDVDTSAGFAYHLEQLVGPYLHQYDDGYELTYAGERIGRTIATGTYTHRVDRPPVELEESCPFCGRQDLEARSADNVVTISCDDCGRSLLRLGVPPVGIGGHGDEFPAAFDRYHRHRLGLAADGVCPDCSGDVSGRLVTPSTTVADELPSEYDDHVQAEFSCHGCGIELRCPVTLAVLDHPSVVSFYHEHGEDVSERPIWNVGHEWTETTLSEEPLAVRVVTELEGDVLALYVDEHASVVDVQRSSADE